MRSDPISGRIDSLRRGEDGICYASEQEEWPSLDFDRASDAKVASLTRYKRLKPGQPAGFKALASFNFHIHDALLAYKAK